MHDLVYLKDLLLMLGIAVVVVIAFHKIKIPTIAGFILSGILIGPHTLGLINNPQEVEILAEIGVALLLFGIGIQLALDKLKRLWKIVIVGGFLQVGLTAGATYAVCTLMGMESSSALFVGFVVSLSSTAIVLQGLQQRGEIEAPHGRLILGILVFQDFSVVPMMLIIPLLIGAEVSAGAFSLALLKSIGIISVILLLAIFIVPRTLKLVARTRQRQLFVLSVFVICLGTAWLIASSGASLAIGAFLAGLVVSGSEYRHQAVADMISFREVFSSLFFISVGMLLSPMVIFDSVFAIIAILAAILMGKAIIAFLAAAVMRMPSRACVIAAVALTQVGEFSLILLYSVQGTGLIAASLESTLVSAAILSMLITPFAMSFGPRLAAGLGKFSLFTHLFEVDSPEDATDTVIKLSNHVIVAGYGFAGREVSQALDDYNVPYIVVDLNAENVRIASQETGKAVYGDITSDVVLAQLGIARARDLLILINDPGAAEHAVRVARSLAPDLYITVRTNYLLDVEHLLKAGADEVVSAEQEAAVQVMTQVLTRQHVDVTGITQKSLEIRNHLEESDS